MSERGGHVVKLGMKLVKSSKDLSAKINELNDIGGNADYC